MTRKAIYAALAAVMLTGAWTAGVWIQPAQAQSTPQSKAQSTTQSAQPTPPAVIKPRPKMAPKSAARMAPAKTAPAKFAAGDYPPCSKTVKDSCIQTWQGNLSQAYPQCAKTKSQNAKAACIDAAFKETKK